MSKFYQQKPAEVDALTPYEGHLVFEENREGITFENLFAPWLKGASRIVVTDPYIRKFYQVQNMMDFLVMILLSKTSEDHIAVELVTTPNDYYTVRQTDSLNKIVASFQSATGIDFSWSYDDSKTSHARHIVTDTRWKISLDRGLDIFQHFPAGDTLSLVNRLQRRRAVKTFEVTHLRI
ncbi:MAG: hypothetical protein OXD38_10225 [Aestuariivita sp.]|nr:hypothetical protein [Aestuariivita sp.]